MQNGDTPHVDAPTDVSSQLGSAVINGHVDDHHTVLDHADGTSTITPATPFNVNGHADASENARGRKRKLSDTRSRSRIKKESPPWKRFGVEGVSSFTEDGRRKSSRTNVLPLDLTPSSDKRTTRREYGKNSQGKSVSTISPSAATANESPAIRRSRGREKGSTSAGSTSRGRSSKRGSSRGSAISARGRRGRRPVANRNRDDDDDDDDEEEEEEEEEGKEEDDDDDNESNGRSSLEASRRPARRGRPPGRPAVLRGLDRQNQASTTASSRPRPGFRYGPRPLPLTHPPNLNIKKKYDTIDELLAQEDFLEGDEIPRQTQRQVSEEAASRLRIIAAGRPSGPLAGSTTFVPETEFLNEPISGYSNADYLCKHMIDFHSRLMRENKDHRAMAKRIATIAAATARTRMPKSQEELALEQRTALREAFRRSCIKELRFIFEATAGQVWAAKRAKYEAQEAAAGADRMKRMVDRSEGLLTGRTGRRAAAADEDASSLLDSELDQAHLEDSDADGSLSGSDSISDDDGDSDTTDDEESVEAGSDDDLTAEQLFSKYKDLPALPDGEADDQDGAEPEEGSSESALDGPLLAGGIDPSVHTLEDVDDIMLDDSEEESSSGDEDSDEDSSADSGDAEDSVAGSDVDEEEDRAADSSAMLMGFLSKSERRKLQEKSHAEGETAARPSTRMALPTSSRVQAAAEEIKADVIMSDGISPLQNGMEQANAINASDDPSRQSTPNTSRASRPESMSSVEPVSGDKLSLLQTHAEADDAERIGVSPLIRGTLRPYQHAGFDWLARMYSESTNGILADEMGLGKTFQTISLLAHLATHHHVWGPHLVVVPTSVMLNWELEFKKFCPGFKVLTYYGTIEERKQKRKGWLNDNKWHVCITSYQLALQDAVMLKRRNWHYLVLDEAHNIKNFRSQRWQTLLSFKSESRLLLTGTPLQNNLSELWSLLFFLTPEYDEDGNTGFGSLQEFSKVFHKPVDQILEHGRAVLDEESLGIVTKLHKVLRPHLLRRLKADVEKQMPKKYEHVTVCRLSKRQRQLYDSYMSLAGTRESFASGNYMSIINCLMQLRKVCNHPDLFDTRQIVTSYAMPKSAVADFEIKELLVRKRLLEERDATSPKSPDCINIWAKNDHSTAIIGRWRHHAVPIFDRLIRGLQKEQGPDSFQDSVPSGINHILSEMRKERIASFENQRALTRARCQGRPIYDSGVLDLLQNPRRRKTPFRIPPRVDKLEPAPMTAEPFFEPLVEQLKCTLPERAARVQPLVQRFGCVTPAVIAPNIARLALTNAGVDLIEELNEPALPDPYQEARIRLSIAFPDKGLIQYDCGKLQQLDKLLRKLQSGGHRALIFTQMTKVLDILEQFMNLHGHRYLRLDGATKIEQRQVLTDRFNNDPRILCFILSSRSGGLGINLTGADTVIFYDLDWNPAMDKQCQDRCHRIGQTRDVHIYRFVSEGTIEANILRKSNQKRMLDDVVIQEGDFTTEYLDKLGFDEADADASTALDKVFGGAMGNGRELQQAEDKEDQEAARVAQKEDILNDDADFDEKPPTSSGVSGVQVKRADSVEVKLSTATAASPEIPVAEEAEETEEISAAAILPRPSYALNDQERQEVYEKFASQGLPQDKPQLRWKRDDEGELIVDEQGKPAELPGYDEYLLRLFEAEMAHVVYAPPKDNKKGRKAKKGTDWGRIRR